MYNGEGVLLGTYSSQTKAAKDLGISRNIITNYGKMVYWDILVEVILIDHYKFYSDNNKKMTRSAS